MASQYHGTVKTGGLPLAGATVTAAQGAKTITTTTDDRGAFSFPDLADGTWTMEIAMLGFEKIVREVAVAPAAPAPAWDMRFLTEAELVASLEPAAPVTKPMRPPPVQPQTGPQGRGAQAGRVQPGGRGRPGFQRLSVNQSADTAALGSEGAIKSEEIADLNQSSANSFIVQGSMSSAVGLAQQNDWSPGGRGMGPDGLGAPGMMDAGLGMGGPGGDGAGGGRGGVGPGGGRGGPGMMMMGGPGGGGPGGPGRGGPGGGFGGRGGPGGFGGPGGPGGGRGGPPPWQNGANAMAFGNNRRDPRNSYNASADFSLDNSIWDARTFSVTGANISKPAYASGRGGFMIGGPLRIPKLVSTGKRIMFTFNYQVQRNRTGNTSDPVSVPTALERLGDFSQTLYQGSPVTIYDPATGVPFPGNKIPTDRISAQALALLNYYPNANLSSSSTRNYQTSWTGKSNSQNINSRLSNIRIGSKDHTNFGIGYQDSASVSPNLFGFVDTGAGRGINANLAWSHTFSARVVNNLQYNFSRMRQQSSPYFAGTQNVAAALGIAGTSQNPLNWGPPTLSLTNYASLTDGNASLNRNQTSAIGDSISWVRGKHNFTAGADYRRQQFNQFSDSNGRGTYTFNGSVTSLLVGGVAQSGTGYDLADLLLGTPATGSIRYGNPDKYFRATGYDTYLNDDWRITPRFSLVLGARWDYATPVTELYNRLVNLDVAPGFTAVAAVEPGQTATYSGSLPGSLIRPDRNNFSPRLGFAWRPLTKGSLVVRGGYGVYYNSSVYNIVASNMAQQPPFAQSLNVSSSASNPLNIASAFLLATTTATGSTYAIDPNYRVGYAQTWNLTVQHDLPFSLFGTAGYLGTKGTRLDQQFIPNSVAPGATESSLPHSFIYETSNGNSIYHAAQFQLNRRFSSGLMAHASYQFSKSIDNAGTGGRGQGNTPVAQNWLDLSADRGLSSFDSRHNLSVQLQYSTGMGTRGGTLLNGWKGALLKDWNIGSNFNIRSGNPFTATAGGNRSQVGGTAVGNTVRASATGLPIDVSGLLFNTAAFTSPLAGEWGTAGRNTIPGPTVFSINGSIGRIFRFGERRSADLRFEAQNLLNHVTITNWGTVVGSNTYGLATAAAGMRKITINLRFRF